LTLHFLIFWQGENIAENSQKAHEVAKTDGVRQHSHTKWRQEICQKQHKIQKEITFICHHRWEKKDEPLPVEEEQEVRIIIISGSSRGSPS
jgi:hypothetical protein